LTGEGADESLPAETAGDVRGPTASARTLMEIETEWAVLPPPPGPDHPQWATSWGYLFETYTPAMRRYVAALLRGRFRRPDSAQEAEDVVQEYLRVCMDKGWLSREAGSIRSFRSFLKTQLYRFTSDHVDRINAKKRRPTGTAPAETLEGVAGRGRDPAEADFDKAFTEATVARAIERVQEANREHAEIVRDLLRTGGAGSADLPARLGREPEAMAVLRHRARKAFAVHLATELKGTCLDLGAFAELLGALEPYLP